MDGIAEVIDFNHCKEFNSQMISKQREYSTDCFGLDVSCNGISLCGFENPYKELKNVLAQHYCHSLDMIYGQKKEAEYVREIRALKEENNNLSDEYAREIRALKEENNNLSDEVAELKRLPASISVFEWADDLDEVVGCLVHAMSFDTGMNAQFYAGPLFTVRELCSMFRDSEKDKK